MSVDVVQITAVVTDARPFRRGLPQSAFSCSKTTCRRRIAHFSSEGSPLEIVVAVDVSESMTNAMPQLKNAVKKFLSALGPKDQVTLTAFNDNLFTLTGARPASRSALARSIACAPGAAPRSTT